MGQPTKLSRQKEYKILADYAELQSLSKTAILNDVSRSTVANVLKRNPDKKCRMIAEKQKELSESVLSYMDSKKDKVCQFLDMALNEMCLPEKLSKASLVQIATSAGILIDKWTMAAGASTGISVSISGDAEEAGN